MLSLSVIMNAFLLSLSLLLVLFFGVFLPGYLALRALASKEQFAALETALLSFTIGIGMVDFSLLILGAWHLPLNALSIGTAHALIIIGLFLLLRLRKIPFAAQPVPFLPSSRSLGVALVFVLFLFFIKVFYLSGTILPTATDLGHHLYWSKLINDTQALPVYEKQEIITLNGHYALSEPEAIADFIIGEHLPVSFIHTFTGASYFGTFPTLFLFLLNLGSVFALAFLIYTFGKHLIKEEKWQYIQADHFFLAGLFLFGGLFSLASPEMKFVSGGVVGNLFGNLFIPVILFTLFRTLQEKSAALLGITLFLIATLAYTHHLSTFILLFIFASLAAFLVLFWHKAFFAHVKDWFFLFLKPIPLGVLGFIVLFALFVTLPTYLETNAVGTAVGTPTKETRTGLTLAQLTASNSAFKLGLALAGLIFIAFHYRLRKNLATVILFAYGAVLLVMTMTPQLLLVDIPSNRIAHYLSFPLGLLALFALLFLVEKSYPLLSPGKGALVFHPLFLAGISIVWLALVAPGLEDNGKTLSANTQGLYVQETFAAARYIQKQVRPEEVVLKDHNFIEASDTWMKLFFNRGYNYPLSRSFFKRYEDNPNREQCTLAMIATPNTALGKQCYQDLEVRFVVINPHFDLAQFIKSPQFSLVYSSPHIAVFYSHHNQ